MSSQARVRSNDALFQSPVARRHALARHLLGGGWVTGLLLLGACTTDDPGTAPTGGTGAVAGTAVAQGGSSVAGSVASAGNGTGGSAGGSTAGSTSAAGTPTNGGTPSAGGVGGGSAGAGGKAGGGAGAGGGSTGGSSSSGCAGKTYKLCEDFESGASGALPTNWTKLKGYGAGAASDVGLATDEFHGGKSSLKSSSMATGQTRAQTSLAALGATASKHWGRIFYKVQSPATKPSSGVLHVTFVGLMGTGENRVVDTVEDTKGAHQWLYNNPDDNGSKGSAYDWSFDAAWHCAEWYVDVSANAYRFFSDSKEVTSIGFTGKTDAQMSNYSSIIVGAEFYQMPPTPFVMWFDDLAIDDNQIGCQ